MAATDNRIYLFLEEVGGGTNPGKTSLGGREWNLKYLQLNHYL